MNEEGEVNDLAEQALRHFYLQEMSIRNLSFRDLPAVSFEEWKANRERWITEDKEHALPQE